MGPVGMMSYVSVVRKNMGLAEETIWLRIGEGVVEDREKKLRKYLVGKFGERPFSVSENQELKIWARGTWKLRFWL